MSFHRNVYDLLDLSPDGSPQAERAIQRHERRCGPLPASVREWYSVKGIVPLSDRQAATPSIWGQYSNRDSPEPLSRLLNRAACLDDRPAGRLVRVMGECQNVGDWRVEFNGSDDPPVWSYDPHHRDPGEEYLLAAPTFSEFVWNWIAEFHQLYKRLQALPQQPNVNAEWAAGNLSGSSSPVVAALKRHLGPPETTAIGFGETRTEFRAEGMLARVTLSGASRAASLWAAAPTLARLRRVTQIVDGIAPHALSVRTSRRNYDGARNGRRN